jgi:hypothetical protein
MTEKSTNESPLKLIGSIANGWRKRLDGDIQNKINFIESTLEYELTDETRGKLRADYLEIVNNYNRDTSTYDFMKDHVKYKSHASGLKDSLFYLREWIGEYQDRILPNSNQIDIGTINDSPIFIEKELTD